MKRTGELAADLGLTLRGDADKAIDSAAMLEQAGQAQLAFVGTAKYFDAGLRSAAGCLIALPEFAGRPDQTVLISPQPRAHFGQALGLLYPAPPLIPGIHPSAQVDPAAHVDPTAEIGPFVTIAAEARIGARTRVGAGTSIGAEALIGDDCTLHPRVSVYDRTTIGARCILHSGAVIGADGFGFEMAGGSNQGGSNQGAAYQKVPQVGTVSIGDNVEIGANTCIDRATLGITVIGDGTKLDNMVHIAHNCVIGKHVVIAAQTGLAGGVSIGDYAVIGGQVGVGDKARIESKAIVGSGAGILTAKIVRAGEPVWGTPARPLRRYLEQLATVARLSRRRDNQ